MIKTLSVLAALFIATPVWPAETNLGAAFRTEGETFQDSCGDLNKLADCAQLLFTAAPLHIAVRSLAPQNGFGSGLAFTAHYTPNEDWRLFWNADAVATPNGFLESRRILERGSDSTPSNQNPHGHDK